MQIISAKLIAPTGAMLILKANCTFGHKFVLGYIIATTCIKPRNVYKGVHP